MNNLPNIKRKSGNVHSFLAFLLFICFSFTSYYIQAQEMKSITLNVQNETAENVFNQLGMQTGLKFFYDQEIVNAAPRITLKVSNVSLQDVLERITLQTKLYFNRDNHTISVGKQKIGQDTSKDIKLRNLKGRVVDQNGEPIIGASVLVKGTANGVITDMDGNYNLINVPENALLAFSYIGYQTVELKANGKGLDKIMMKEDNELLDEVVVVGYGVQKKRDVTTAIASIRASDYKLGDSDMQAIGASLRYFSLGEVQESRDGGMGNQLILNPYEMAFDVSYSRKLSDVFSMAVALRYIRSDMGASSDADMVPDNAFAADIAGYLEKYVILGNSECLWSFGFNVSNIGTKVSYDGGNTNQFLPTTLKVGTGLLYPIDDYNQIGIYVDLSKYLVPVEPRQDSGEDEADFNKRKEDYNNMSPITGIFKSFGDSPNGFKGELEEIMASIGLEYNYNQQFFVRGGYYYENKYQGNRQYFSVGAGFRMSVFQLDAAYLISTVQSNPLDQTLRFSLSFDMDGIKNLFR